MATKQSPNAEGSGDNADSSLTAKSLSAMARSLYADGPFLLRTLQHFRPFICPFERLIGHVRAGSSVLDVGCGAGLLLSLAAATGRQFEGLGFDVSPMAIDLAKTMTKRAMVISPQARLSFERLDVDAHWPEGVFDVVFLIDVLHHVPPASQHSLVKRVISKVKPGGTLVYKDMCQRPWWKAQANRLQDLMIARELISYVPVQTVENWAGVEGMQVILSEDLSRFWCGHELRVMRRPLKDAELTTP
jgi:2-polyprenyl-3-methyl-5-hydroxy-6-metoxy-1,4-benzoquinol methylase